MVAPAGQEVRAGVPAPWRRVVAMPLAAAVLVPAGWCPQAAQRWPKRAGQAQMHRQGRAMRRAGRALAWVSAPAGQPVARLALVQVLQWPR